MTVQEAVRKPQAGKKPQVAIMNAVHDLPVLVARDEGFFKDEGLDIEFVTTPGMAQVTTSHTVKFESVFDRPLDSVGVGAPADAEIVLAIEGGHIMRDRDALAR